ncbi:hypothetical protein ILUMI_07264 [Ignelater luminosus]|uniref:Integrase p58-like C-terminal domain-containing protein n=1 Tax=Ignelater luminosus TaxID=2038154 RepID=A0A8K0D8M7_IGNLU|nr:hypothetical protein ILUMI_07264 [Ignelater luminosus]
MKNCYDVTVEAGKFNKGDLVWLCNRRKRKEFSLKLQCNWEGLYTIVKQINDVVYRIKKTDRAKPKVVHIIQLAPYRGNHKEDEQDDVSLRLQTVRPEVTNSFKDLCKWQVRGRHFVTEIFSKLPKIMGIAGFLKV